MPRDPSIREIGVRVKSQVLALMGGGIEGNPGFWGLLGDPQRAPEAETGLVSDSSTPNVHISLRFKGDSSHDSSCLRKFLNVLPAHGTFLAS